MIVLYDTTRGVLDPAVSNEDGEYPIYTTRPFILSEGRTVEARVWARARDLGAGMMNVRLSAVNLTAEEAVAMQLGPPDMIVDAGIGRTNWDVESENFDLLPGEYFFCLSCVKGECLDAQVVVNWDET